MRRAYATVRQIFLRLRDRPGFWTLVLAGLLAVAVVLGGALGAANVPLAELPAALVDPAHPAYAVLWSVRLPRVVNGALVGAALGVAGALMQAAVRNPLADPGLLGVTAGAGLGGLLAIVLRPQHPSLLPVAAFVGGLLAVATLLTAAWGGGRVTGPLRIVLSGVAVQAILFAMISLVTFFFADRAPAFVSFTIGSLNGVGWDKVLLILGPVVVGCGLALLSTRTLNLMLLDDDSAGGVGLAVRRARVGASCLAALLAAGAASVAGLVGFVGLVIPNWVRVLVGPDHRVLLPLCVLGGAALVVFADTAARMVAAPLELPVGALLALVGGPYFLFVLWRKLA
ncbi:MAG: iron ABC transporter permease [bacterium]|nr:iron ABC transporter permease [bacterium]